MMKKTFTIISIIGSLFIILDSIDAGHLIMLFFLAGVVPGTNILISPVDMMAAHATAITVLIMRITLWPKLKNLLFSPVETPRAPKKRSTRRVA